MSGVFALIIAAKSLDMNTKQMKLSNESAQFTTNFGVTSTLLNLEKEKLIHNSTKLDLINAEIQNNGSSPKEQKKFKESVETSKAIIEAISKLCS